MEQNTILSSQQIPLADSKKPLFSELCRFLEIVAKEKGDAKKRKLDSYLKNWRRRYGNDLYPILRLLVPHLDKERTSYGMKENVIAKIYVGVLGLSKNSTNAERLIHWKMPGSNKNRTAGDFASIAFEVIAPRSTVIGHGKMSIDDVNNQLDILNAATGHQEYKNVIRHFFANYTAIEQKWIIRIILKALNVGLSEKLVFQMFHPDASTLFNVCSDLRKVARDLQEPHTRLSLSEITVFHPFKPMLSKPVAIQNIIKQMNGSFWIEEKLDGERMQLHMKDGRFEYYSRKATQYTYMYGPNKYEGSLTRYIYDSFNPRVTEIILDGEMIPYDSNSDICMPFGFLKPIAADQSVSEYRSTYPLFVVFDVVLINGKMIIDQPLERRREWLRSLITDKPGHLKVLGHKVGREMKDLSEALDEANMKRQEGIIIKKPTSNYVLNERTDDCIKVKLDYLDTLGDSFDLLLVGANYGHGKRSNLFGSFMCALRDSNAPDDEPRFLTFCRFGTGFTMKEGEQLKNLDGWTRFDQDNVPDWLMLGRDKPQMIIPPEMSIVVQVKAAEIIPTNMFAADFTLRFPRFEVVRDDKDWRSATSFEEMTNLRLQAVSHSQSRKLTESDMTNLRSARRKIRTVRRRVGLLETFVSLDSTVENKSDIFKGIDFHIVVKDFDKSDLERMIKEHGGRFFQHPDASSDLRIIADLQTTRVNNIIKSGKHDVVHPQWILDCVDTMKTIPLSPKYMLYTSESTKREFITRMDKFGDNYTDLVDIDSLKEIFEMIPTDEGTPETDNERERKRRRLGDDIERRYFKDKGLPNGLFRHHVIYIDYPPLRNENDAIDGLWALQEGCRDRLKLIESILRYHDAHITSNFRSNRITHVIFDEQDLSRVRERNDYYISRGRNPLPQFVRSSWVTDSENIGALLREKGMYLKIFLPNETILMCVKHPIMIIFLNRLRPFEFDGSRY
ncbi:2306_t:CDS:10 [Acaulospora morrowiae]|uniref:DNA ligase n=1 Tax=Acaulospora morrowiae TaxID=94023 RepID=A0A9N8W237_9GLOM|nr:2306_t:CDS:10 [Acaulospora morrowiae]